LLTVRATARPIKIKLKRMTKERFGTGDGIS